MPRPSYDALDQQYQEALRQIAQERRRYDVIERLLLGEAARHRQSSQSIEMALEQMKRRENNEETARVMQVVARANHVDLGEFDTDPHGERNG